MSSSIDVRIRGYHADMFGHVNHARYLEFLEEGRWSYLEENNLFNVFRQQKLGHVVVNININYRKASIPGDKLRVETRVMKAGHKSVTLQQEILKIETGILLVDAQVTNVFFDMDTKETVPVEPDLVDLWPDLAAICTN